MTYEQNDFRQLNYPAGKFDLIVSSISIHHLTSAEKRRVFQGVYHWLNDQGVICYADQCAGAPPELYDRHIKNWKQISLAAGTQEPEWQMRMKHQADHNHHDTLVSQIDWLRETRFSTVDCTWRYLLWSVIQAQK